jgi:RND family efflux transporter MFP subunit
MLTKRFKRTAVWAIVLVVMVAALALGRMEEKAHGSFTVRSATRADVRAPLTGLLASVACDEGDRMAKGSIVAMLHIPDLDTRLAQRRAEVLQSEARIRMLRAGGGGDGASERDGAVVDDAARRVAQIDAETAHTAQVEAELRHLEAQQRLLAVPAPVGGIVVTPRLRDRTGQLVTQGDLICALAEPAELEIEIVLDEQEASDLRAGQPVELKARALPYQTFHATVQRIAPAAVAGDVQSKLAVYCTMSNPSLALRPGMSGHARIHCGARPAGMVLFGRLLRTLRTEFWW